MKALNRRHTVVVFVLVAAIAVLAPSPAFTQPLAKGQTKFLGNAIGPYYWPNFGTYWNQVTAENAGKWGSVEGTQGGYYWTPLDGIYTYAMENNYQYRHHTLVWGNQAPLWITSLDSAAQRAAVKKWIDTVASRYEAASFVDVVNEPFHALPSFANALGGSGATGWDWVVTSFQWARQAFHRGVKLTLNEYSILHDNTATTNFLRLIDTLRVRGLIDAIGIQGHGFEFKGSGYAHSPSTLKVNLDRLAATGLPVYITEFDISEALDATQLQDYQTYFSILWENPGVKGITLWGYVQGDIWRQDGYLVRTNGSERPAMAWLRIYVATPAKVSPLGASSEPRNPLIIWRRSTPATSYRLQVSADTSFSAPVVDSAVPDTSARVNPLSANTTYYWRVAAANINGTSAYSTPGVFTTNDQVVTGVNDDGRLPSDFALQTNYPNPFNPSTEIRFTLPRSSTVRLTVYDLLGTAVRTLVDGPQGAGEHAVVWDATNGAGEHVSSGVYVYRLETGEGTLSRKMMLLR